MVKIITKRLPISENKLYHHLTISTNVDNCTVTFSYDGNTYPPTFQTNNTYTFSTLKKGGITYNVKKTYYNTQTGNVASILDNPNISVTLTQKQYQQVIYDSTGNEYRINELYALRERQFEFADTQNKKINGELEPFVIFNGVADYGFYYAFRNCTGITGVIDFSMCNGSTGNHSFEGAFIKCTGLTGFNFDKIESAYDYAFKSSFENCTGLTEVIFPKMTRAFTYSFYQCFRNCSNITTVSFPLLREIYQNAFETTFNGCNKIKSISFPSATYILTDAFKNMFSSGNTVEEIHFKESMAGNVECTASKMGCPNATFYFDLP